MVEAIFEAAARVFGESGFEAATTNAIAERAGVSVGSLYQYFPNKRVLLEALHERCFEDAMQKLADACERGLELPLAEAVRGISETNAACHCDEQALARVFHMELPPIWPDRKNRACVVYFREKLQALFETHQASLRVTVEQALFFTLALGSSVVKSALAERPEDLKNGVIARETTEAIMLFLTGVPTGQPAEMQASA